MSFMDQLLNLLIPTESVIGDVERIEYGALRKPYGRIVEVYKLKTGEGTAAIYGYSRTILPVSVGNRVSMTYRTRGRREIVLGVDSKEACYDWVKVFTIGNMELVNK